MHGTRDAPRRKAYIPNMADHAYALAAAIRHHGADAEALPPPSDASLHTDVQSGAALRQKIEAALAENTDVNLTDIVVEVIGRQVTLGGVVGSAEEQADAEWAAWSVTGVAAVDNRLLVEEPPEH